MRKTKKSSLTAILTASAVALSTLVFSTFVGADVTYSKPYTMGNVLTDYQYFVKGDFNSGGHIVGSVAIGGTMDAGTSFGDGIITPSYINNIKNAMLAGSNYTPDEKLVYYGTNSSSGTLESRFIENPDFINMEEAFNSLRQESVAIANSATKIITNDDVITQGTPVYGRGLINLDLSELKELGGADEVNVVIPYSIFKDLCAINITGYDHIDYIKENKIFISVTGVGSEDVPKLQFKYPTDSTTTYISWNGNFYEQYFNGSNGLSGGTNSNEVNLQGMKLVWNFPDAENLQISSLSGHLFAPNADLEIIEGGRHEGGIIVNKLIRDNSSEAHYYPYYNPRAGFVETPETTAPIDTSEPVGETTAPTDTSETGGGTTAPTDTSETGGGTTAPTDTSETGGGTTAPTDTSETGGGTSDPTDTSQTGGGTSDPTDTSTTPSNTSDGSNVGGGSDQNTNIGGGNGNSENPDSGVGSIVGFATASLLAAITLSVASRKKKIK